MRRSSRGAVLAAALGALLLGGAAPARADAADLGREGGLGFASMLASLVYGPVKGVYALGGLLVGGCAYVFSGGDAEVAAPILNASVRGDYLITPRILTGDDELEFIGRSPGDRQARQRATQSQPGF